MGVEEAAVNSIMSGIENTGGVKQHNHKKKLRQRFDIIKKLGQGTFGKVQLGINKETGQEVAIKTIKKSKIESDADLIRIRREIQIMSSVQHPNIIHIYEENCQNQDGDILITDTIFENREKMVLVMEYAAGGELYDYLSERKVLPEDEARRIFRQIATACYYCHKHKICHRDLKLENILLDENNNAKIADFGLSNVFDDQRLLNTFCGSPLYASPEIVKGTPYQGPEVDCWSLGVLLYTLVYGAMPFDGSNFKRLVKQISQGDYYEPSKPSPASPLIREMLTVNPKKRAGIEQICSHWWVNETYNECCLDISEELANQTPVRLDVLLSLAPPAPQLESANLVVNVTDEGNPDTVAPTRSQSVGSLMELTSPERRIIDLINEEKYGPKRKLESTVSTDRANIDKRREKIIKENTVADITVHGAIREDASQEDANMAEAPPLNKSLTQTISREKEMDVEGAACQEIMEEVKEKENATVKKPTPSKIKRTQSNAAGKVLEGINEIPSQENNLDKENKSELAAREAETAKKETVKEEKPTGKKKVIKKKILADKNDNEKGVKPEESHKAGVKEAPKEKENEKHQVKENGTAPPKQEKPSPKQEETPTKPVERRKSRIFEAAEKFQSMISPTETKSPPVEKPKKILIPGVSVDGFKKEFERKASLTSSAPAKPKSAVTPKKTLIDKQKSEEEKVEHPVEKQTNKVVNNAQESKRPEVKKQFAKPEPEVPKQESPKTEDNRKEKVKNAVSIISSALDKEGARKSKSRPCIIRKPPVPFGVSGRSASGNIASIGPLSPPIQNVAPKPFVRPCYENKLPIVEAKQVKEEEVHPPVDEPKTSNAEITLKSATLPRRKTTKAQIQLNYPAPKAAPQMEFRTEAAHNVEAPLQVRSEVVVPVGPATPTVDFRATELQDRSSKERVIPIAFEKIENGRETVQSPPAKPPMPRPFQSQKSNISQRSGSLSRQSTQDSDSETTTSTGEPIKKSPREYIIPIAVEGGGYVTPRAGSLEPSDTASTASTMTNRSKTKFGRGARRLNSLLSDRDSEDESPFSALHRHSSFGKDSDTEDSKKDNFPHMHRLRRIRPKKSTLEHADSLSSGEEDDDDGFEILTAENLFSTLLSRVRDLTQRLNVDDGVRPGFPNSRLLSHFDHGTNFWNRMDNPLTRHSSLSRTFGRPSAGSTQTNSSFGVPWRRSVSKDLASDIQSVFNDQDSGGVTARIPRGDDQTDNPENLNLAELDLKKLNLSEEDRLALSHLTPGLSKRIQKQLLAQLTPSEIRKLHRTLSSKTSDEIEKRPEVDRRSSVGRMSCTLPRKSGVDKDLSREPDDTKSYGGNTAKSFLPVKFGASKETYKPSYEFSVRSSSIGADPRGDYKFSYSRPKVARSVSTREPRITRSNLQSPESSISESLSKNDDTSNSYRQNTDSYSSKYSDSSLSRPYSRYTNDSSYSRYTPNRSNQSLLSPTSPEPPKTDSKPSQPTRRISRFLRPDFFEPKEENVYIKEKKERERETQQVLKEIRDKRKSRLRSQSRNRGEAEEKRAETPSREVESKQRAKETSRRGIVEPQVKLPDQSSEKDSKSSKELQNNQSNRGKCVPDYVNMSAQNSVSDNITKVPSRSGNSSPDTSAREEASMNNTERVKSPINGSKVLHDYVNVKVAENSTPTVKKENRISRLTRPKSYPAESIEKEQTKGDKSASKVENNVETSDKLESNGKESKISKLKKGFCKKEKPSKEAKNEANKTINEEDKAHKNKLLHSIEKKLEKFRSNNVAATKDPEEVKALLDKKTIVDSAIKRLREQSLPRNLEQCTESGLIKRAVSVEDLAVGTKPLQASKKSVTKILGLFKKYEDNDKKKEKPVKKSKVKDDKKAKEGSEEKANNEPNVLEGSKSPSNLEVKESEKLEKKERPKSLLLDKVKHFQNNYNGAKSDSLLDQSVTNEKPKSKLPLNSFRRSLNLDNLPEPPKFYTNHSTEGIETKPDRRNLKLDFSRIPSKTNTPTIIEPVASTSGGLDDDARHNNVNRNSLTTTDDSSTVFSPTDDYLSCDSWSACSDFHHLNDLHSPQSYNGHALYSGDESESVIDRIRRKSFYTRFNEKKRPRKPSVDLYARDYGRDYGKPDYSSLDRYRSPGVTRRTSFTSYIPEDRTTSGPSVSSTREYKPYVRSASVLNDYVNVSGGHQNLTHSYQNVPGSHQSLIGSYQHLPGSYQTYSSRIARPSSVTGGLYSDSDSHLDDILTSAIPRRHSPYSHRSTLDRGSVSPVSEHYYTGHRPSSVMQSPTGSEPI